MQYSVETTPLGSSRVWLAWEVPGWSRLLQEHAVGVSVLKDIHILMEDYFAAWWEPCVHRGSHKPVTLCLIVLR